MELARGIVEGCAVQKQRRTEVERQTEVRPKISCQNCRQKSMVPSYRQDFNWQILSPDAYGERTRQKQGYS